MYRSAHVVSALFVLFLHGAAACATASPPGGAAADAGPRGDDPDATASRDPLLPDATPGGPDADPDAVTFASSTAATPDAQGLSITSKFWPGWRFEVPADFDLHVHHVGFYTAGGTGTAFAALVALDGPAGVPTPLTLAGDDVLAAPVVFAVPSTAGDVRAPMDVTLSAGWYAVVFGTGQFGASSEASTLITRGHAPVAGAQLPFVTNQNTGDWYQSTLDGLRFFVEGRRSR